GSKPIVMTTLEHSRIGRWTADAAAPGVAFCRGLGGAARGLRAMREQVRAVPARVPAPGTLPRPDGLVESDAGLIVPFDDSMRLLEAAGVAVAPGWVYEPAAWSSASPAGGAHDCERFVVKLADVPH